MDVTAYLSQAVAVVVLMLGASWTNHVWEVRGASYGALCDVDNPCDGNLTCKEGICGGCGTRGNNNGSVDNAAMCVPKETQEISVTPTRNVANHWVGFNISWTPGNLSEPTSYEVVVEESVSLESEEFQPLLGVSVRDYNNTEYLVPDLLASWNYRIVILVWSDTGISSWYEPVYATTLINYPGTILNLTVHQDAIVAQQIEITFHCPQPRHRNGSITGFVIRKTLLSSTGDMDNQEEFLVSSSSTSLSCVNISYAADTVGGVLVERTYSFAVLGLNQDYAGNFTEEFELYIAPRVPRLSSGDRDLLPPLLRSPDDTLPSSRTIEVEVCATCLLDASQGAVRAVGLLVCVHGVNSSCSDTDRRTDSHLTVVDFFTFPTWAEANRSRFDIEYRTTPDAWHELLPNNSETFLYIVGSNTSCDVNQSRVYCNGPLPPDKTITLSVIQCNDAGCDIVTFYGNFTTKDFLRHLPGLNVVGLAIGIGQGCLIILTAVVMGVVMWCRREASPQEEEVKERRRSSVYSRQVSTSTDGHDTIDLDLDIEMMEEARDELSELESPQSDVEDPPRPSSRRASVASLM